MATSGAAGGVQMATLDPSSSRASSIGLAAGSSPSGRAMWIAARWSHCGGEFGCVVGFEPARPLDPDVAGSVDHDLGDLRVSEQLLEARKERSEVADAARALHIRPSSRCRQ